MSETRSPDQQWVTILTPIGTFLCKVNKTFLGLISKTWVDVHDLCAIITTPSTIYIDHEENQYTEEEALKIGFIKDDKELEQIEGPLKQVYVPCYDDIDRSNTFTVNFSNLIGYKVLGDRDDLTQTVDKLFGRVPVKKI